MLVRRAGPLCPCGQVTWPGCAFQTGQDPSFHVVTHSPEGFSPELRGPPESGSCVWAGGRGGVLRGAGLSPGGKESRHDGPHDTAEAVGGPPSMQVGPRGRAEPPDRPCTSGSPASPPGARSPVPLVPPHQPQGPERCHLKEASSHSHPRRPVQLAGPFLWEPSLLLRKMGRPWEPPTPSRAVQGAPGVGRHGLELRHSPPGSDAPALLGASPSLGAPWESPPQPARAPRPRSCRRPRSGAQAHVLWLPRAAAVASPLGMVTASSAPSLCPLMNLLRGSRPSLQLTGGGHVAAGVRAVPSGGDLTVADGPVRAAWGARTRVPSRV